MRTLVGIALVFGSASCWGYYRSYLPLSAHELALRFPQRVLARDFRPGDVAHFGSTTVRSLESGGEVQFSGVDAAGKPWQVTASAWSLGASVYTADLDHNGIPDLIYAGYTGGCGLAPPMHVLTILFDTSRRPIPSEMDGYFEVDKRGLTDLVDLDGDGRAELIRQAYDDGYWITSLYEARGAHWHSVNGAHASRTFPMYTRFTTRPNRIPVTPSPHRHPMEDDLSNDVIRKSGTIQTVHWANVEQSENPDLVLLDGTVCTPIAWYSTMVVVVDGPDGRMAATLHTTAETLFQQITALHLPIRITGHRRYDTASDQEPRHARCVPEAIWASRR